MDRVKRFKVIFKGNIMGCMRPERKYDIGFIEVEIPDNVDINDGYALTEYIESYLDLFVLEIHDIN